MKRWDDTWPRAGSAPALRHRVAMGADFDALAGDAALTAETAQSTARPSTVAEEDSAVILYTSGTTGRLKGAMLTHLGIVHSSMHFEVVMGLTERDSAIAAVPLSHVTGLIALITTLVRCAGKLVIMPAFKAAAYLELAERERITTSLMVPAMYRL